MIDWFYDIKFSQPGWFWALAIVPLMIAWHIMFARKRTNRVPFSDTGSFSNYKPTMRQRLGELPLILRLLTVVCMVVALARPQSSSKGQNVTSEGISIMLAMDISRSMLAEDLKPNRVEAAKKVAMEFIDGRPTDLIGLVIFSGESFTMCPLTSDHGVLKNQINNIKTGMLQDGTAIGEGLATAVARLKDARTKGKVIILLTDGVNNVGQIAPVTAGEIAKTFGIRVYSIGAGSMGTAPYPFKDVFGRTVYQNVEVQIDEPVLKQISAGTDGKYFRATNTKKLHDIYAEIDKMEKTKIEVTEFRRYSEEYWWWAVAAALFFALEIVLRYSLLRSLP